TVCYDDHQQAAVIEPHVQVVKSVPSRAHEGDKVSYDFKVTNIGDTDLTNVTVVDDKLGDIGTIASLKVGESKTLTKDFTVPAGVDRESDRTNTSGVDVLALKVVDDDSDK